MGMRVLLVGHGRMGRLVASLSAEYGIEIAGHVDRHSSRSPGSWPAAEVAIDFSTADAVAGNVRHLAERGTSVVIGTTGWGAEEPELRRETAARGIGVVAAPNFALGVNLFAALAARAAELMESHDGFGAWIHEAHHAAKRDAPSGTALLLASSMRGGGLRSRDRRVLHTRGDDSGHAHDRLRRRRGDHHADPHGSRSIRLRARRAGSRAVGPRPAGVVHDARCDGDLTELRGFRVYVLSFPLGYRLGDGIGQGRA